MYQEKRKMKLKRIMAFILVISVLLQSSAISMVYAQDVFVDTADPEVSEIEFISEDSDEFSSVPESQDTSQEGTGQAQTASSGEEISVIDEETERTIKWIWFFDEKGVLSLSGEGSVEVEENPWAAFADQVTIVEVGEKITEIQEGLFNDFENLEKIVFENEKTVFKDKLECEIEYRTNERTESETETENETETDTETATEIIEQTESETVIFSETDEQAESNTNTVTVTQIMTVDADGENVVIEGWEQSEGEIILSQCDLLNIRQISVTGVCTEETAFETEDSILTVASSSFGPKDEKGDMEFHVLYDIHKEQLAIVDENRCELFGGEIVLRLPEYDIPSGITQEFQPLQDGVLSLIRIGEETEGRSLNGYSVQLSMEEASPLLMEATDEEGEKLEYEETDGKYIITLPEGACSPYDIYAVYNLDEIGDADQYIFHAELLHPTIIPSIYAVWSDCQILEADENIRKLTWQEFFNREIEKYDIDSMSEEEYKNLYAQLKTEYGEYYRGTNREVSRLATNTVAGMIRNEYLEAAINDNGQFTLGTVLGDPDFDTDNYKKLLYGHPSPGTSETLIKIDNDEYIFTANQGYITEKKAVAVMNIQKHNISVVQELTLVKSGNVNYEDSMKISYSVTNNGSSAKSVGVRIMMDTMLNSNDRAPFRIAGVGDVTTIRTFTGNDIPSFYQVYDNLDNPTTLATGYLITANNRKPDKVQFTNWGGIRSSSWNHSPSEGAGLGDSAIGIYFNPVSVENGKNISVSTYYGVGLGLKTSSAGSNVLDKDHVQIEVLNLASRDGIEDADVTVDSNSYQTNENGCVIVPLAEADNKTITILKADYESASMKEDLEGGHTYTILLKKAGDTTPIIQEVICGNVNLLTKAVEFCEDTSSLLKKNENQSKIAKIKIQVKSDTPDCVYYLYEENEQIMHNDNGIFEFDTLPGNHGDLTYISELSAGKRYYVRCVSKADGKESKEQILLRVHSPSLSISSDIVNRLQSSDFTVLPGSLGDLKNNLFINILAGPGESKFKLGTSKGGAFTAGLSVNLDVNKQLLKVGINADHDFLDNESAVNTYKNCANRVYRSSKGNDADKKKLDEVVKRWQKSGKSQYNIGKLSTNINFLGYGEFKLADENKFSGTIYFTISGGYEASKSFNFPPHVIPVPTYITIGSDGEIELKMVGPVNFSDCDGFLSAIAELFDELHAYIGVSFEFGAGNSTVAKVGGKVKGGMDFLYNFKSTYYKLGLKAAGSIEAKALIWSWSFPVAEANWIIMEDYGSKKGRSSGYLPMAGGAEAEGDELTFADLISDENMTMTTRGYSALEPEENEDGMHFDADDVVLSNVYTSAAPVLLTVGNDQYRFWLHDIESRAAQNRTALVYTVNDGPVKIVEDDRTADFGYTVVTDGTKVYAAWMDCNRVFPDNVTRTEMEKSLDISVAQIEGDRIVNYTITQDTRLDQLPALLVDGNKVYITWNSMESGFFEEVKDNKIHYCTLANGTVSGVTSTDVVNQTIGDMKLRLSDGSPTVIYTTFEWNEEMTQTIQVTHYLTLTTGAESTNTIKEAETTPCIAELNGQSMVFWYGGNNIYYAPYGEDDSVKTSVFAEENIPANLSGNFIVVPGNGCEYLIWVGTQNTETDDEETIGNQINNAYICKYSSETGWGEPYQIAQLGMGNILDLSAVTNEDGSLVLSWQRVEYNGDGELIASDLMKTTIDGFTDLMLTDVTYDDAGVGEGQEFAVTLQLKNNGNTFINNADVFIDGSRYEITDLNLNPGESTEKIITYVIPYSGEYTYEVEVNVDGDRNSSNNCGSFTIGRSMLRLVQKDIVMQSCEEVQMLEIVNEAGYAAENVALRIYSDENRSVLLFQTRDIDIEAHNSAFIAVPIGVFEETSCIYALLIPEGEEEEELTTIPLYYSKDALRVLERFNFAVEIGEGGNINSFYDDSYQCEDVISLKAEPEDGYVFWQWTEANGCEIEDPWNSELEFIMPDHEVTLKAEFIREEEATDFDIVDDSVELKVGDSNTLTAALTPADASVHPVWSSSDDSVVSVDIYGTITAVSSGTATITAVCGELSDTCTVSVKDIPIESIDLITPIYINGIGEKQQMDAVLEPVTASEDIVWSSSDEAVATVDQTGMVTTTGCGDVVITAASAGNSAIKAECTVHVTAVLEELRISETNVILGKEETKTLTLITEPVSFTQIPNIEWISYDEDVVTVTPSGNGNQAEIKGVGKGETLIEAKSGDISAICMVSVRIPATNITLSYNSLNMYVNDSTYLDINMVPNDAYNTYTLTSSNTSIVRLSGQRVYAVAPGSATITATTDNGLRAVCRVTVMDIPKASKIYMSNSKVEIYEGDTYYLNINVIPDRAEPVIRLRSSNPRVVSVAEGERYIRGINPGTATITATTDNGKSATCTVTVRAPQNLTVATSISQLQSDHDYKSNMNHFWKYSIPTKDGMKVTFAKESYLERGYDKLRIYDEQGTLIGTYTGGELSELTVTVPGSMLKLHMTTDGSICKYGFKVTKIEPIPHTFGTWTTQSKSTAVKYGVQVRRCSKCGEKETRKLPKLKPTMKLSAKKLPLQVKKSFAVSKLVSGLAAGDSIKSYKTLNSKIATVSKTGKVTGKRKGTAVIEITLASGKKGKVTFVVQSGAVKTSKITNVKKSYTLKKGKKLTLKPILAPLTSLEKITYSTSNKKVASVTSAGVIKAVKPGKATIKIKSGKKKITVKITVK